MDKKPATDPKIDWGFYAVTPRIVRTKYKDLSHTEKWLYTCLRDLCGKKGTCFRSLRSLKEETDISIASLSAMIPRLHAAGLIHAEKKRRSASGKEIWHISIVDIWQMNKDHCSENEQSNGEDVQNLNNDPEIVHSVNNDVQNLNKTPEDCSENERDCSNFRNRRRDSKNKDTEIYNEEEGTYRASGSQGQECADAQTTPSVPYHPDFNADQSRIATDTEDHDNECMGRSSVSGDVVRHLHGAQGDSPETQGDTRQAASASNAGANRLPESTDGHTDSVAGRNQQAGATTGQNTPVTGTGGGSGYQKPAVGKRGGRKASEEKVPAPEFTEGGRKVNDAWASLFKSPPSVGPKTIECANALYAQLMPWCRELKVQCRDLLDEIKKWEYATDPDYYRKRGVALCDIHRDFERWQSVKTEALEQEKRRAANPTASPLFDTSAIEQMRANRLRYAGGMQA